MGKIKKTVREKYAHFLRLGINEPLPLPADRCPYDAHGITAEECFHQIESTGGCTYCREPELLHRYIIGKEYHGITVKTIVEDFVISRTIFSLDIRENYPAWIANEIFKQSKAFALQKLGFIPSFVQESRDWSEMPQWEFNQKMRPILATMINA
jgi:hypothetical protein